MATTVQEKIERLVRPEVRAMHAYGVADPGDLIKLDAMENPYPWPEQIKKAWLERLLTVEINRYPDPAARHLKTRLREAMGVPVGMEVLLGNGSDELIQMILLVLARPGAKVLAPTPTFVMYEATARFVGMQFIGVPLKPRDFALDVPAMRAAMAEHNPAAVFLAYPNNPTGNLFAATDIEEVIRASQGLVVIDEAYHAFAGRSFIARLEEFDNVVVMRTVSKLGLAGLRLGLLAGETAWLAEFDKVRLPYNINSLTQASAEFALANRAFLDEQTERICHERDRLFDSLSKLPDLKVWPSRANFILFRPATRKTAEVLDGLRKAGILIKKLDKSDPALTDCLRVTVGTPEENAAFLGALKKLI